MAEEAAVAAKEVKEAAVVTLEAEDALVGSATVLTVSVVIMVVQAVTEEMEAVEAEELDTIGMVVLGLQRIVARMVQEELRAVMEEPMQAKEVQEAMAEMAVIMSPTLKMEILVIQETTAEVNNKVVVQMVL